jgi:hypothetical protein
LNVGNNATILPNTVAQFALAGESYIQTNLVNTNDGGTADIVVTANTGTDSTYFLDAGFANKDYVPGTEYNNIGDIITMKTANNNIINSTVTGLLSNSEITISENAWLTFPNVATIIASANSNTINIVSLTGSYDTINNKQYSNTAYPLKDIVYAGDNILVANNTSKKVKSVDYENGIITLTTNLTSNANSYLSVNRTFEATDVTFYGPLGTQYIPQLTTEDGEVITTEDNRIILLG